MKRIVVVTHPTKPQAAQVLDRIRKAADESGLEIVESASSDEADLVLAVGGDGTILRAARLAHRHSLPLVGVNVGRLGFLSSIEVDDLEKGISAIARDEFEIEERMMLRAELAGTDPIVALNEIVVERSIPARVIHVRVRIDDEQISTYTADGVIVASPSGSTGYSLSAGGPVVEAGMDAIVVTPVSSHEPHWRSSFVIESNHTVGLELVEGSAAFSADGEPVAALEIGHELLVYRQEEPLRLMRSLGTGGSSKEFVRKLRTRFRLSG